MLMKIRIAIIEDHQLVLQSYELYFKNTGTVKVMDTFNGGTVFQKNFPRIHHAIDLVLLDLKLPDHKGTDIIGWIKTHYPKVKILVLSSYEDTATIVQCICKGADGYMIKNCSYSELEEAIVKVYNHMPHLPDTISWATVKAMAPQMKLITSLKPQELEFLQHTASDRSYGEIALLMNKSPKTVDNYRNDLFRKLQVRNRTGLVLKALAYNLISI